MTFLYCYYFYFPPFFFTFCSLSVSDLFQIISMMVPEINEPDFNEDGTTINQAHIDFFYYFSLIKKTFSFWEKMSAGFV